MRSNLMQVGLPGSDVDIIHVRNLQLPAGVEAPDIWYELKVQPGVVSIELTLRNTFDTAAAADLLDDSTIHYGHLCKNVRKACKHVRDPEDTLETIFATVHSMALKNNGKHCILSNMRATLSLPKASAYGGMIEMTFDRDLDEDGDITAMVNTTSYKQLQIMTLIGVNEQERTGQQLLVVSCDFIQIDGRTALCRPINWERNLVHIIQETDFDTLESLANHTVTHLTTQLADFSVHRVHLKLEKPSAVTFADAPAIEIQRLIKLPEIIEEDEGAIEMTSSELGDAY